ncbi:hypothetical protein DFA_09139 [Cavenderia fasciculata]|uniref:Uncharacterized protein n=1 Tax=Cavenderia fasciculata TaxID=261658 RepID=F4Q6T2_CACFS|nr:uncharacterized protein DFA_09139 [Cavenderia fasciculata]EGG16592.1 hypothetical protein DFA_09139 [Cavenderia fasciculata]|eukprot:XP_004354992.1 hypothetical protein DFA_09139 [Cavenderia fasciculata]
MIISKKAAAKKAPAKKAAATVVTTIQSSETKLVQEIFKQNVEELTSDFFYESDVHQEETYQILHTDVSYYQNAATVINMIEKNNLGLEFLKNTLPSYNKKNEYYTHPILLKFIPYNEAINLFDRFDRTSNQVARVFIALQFFIYFYYKKDKNVRQVNAFRDKLLNDQSQMVKACGLLMEKYYICVKDKHEKQLIKALDMLIQMGHVPLSEREGFIQNFKNDDDYYSMDYINFYDEEECEGDPEKLKYIKPKTSKSIKRQKKLPDMINPYTMNFQRLNGDTFNKIVQKIIGYTIKTDTFLKQDLMPETKSQTWMDLLDELTTVLFRLATVSKQFHYNVGQVLDRIDWTRRFPNKCLKGQINYGRPLCLFKSVPTTMRYDALVRTTPFHLFDAALAKAQSLTIVGDVVECSLYGGDDDEETQTNKEVTRRLFSTYPAYGSMPNLKKLKVVGRAFKTHKQQAQTGGQYLMWYIISNVGCKLEEFDIDSRISLEQMGNDVQLVKYLFKHHKSSLKVVRLKYAVIKKINEARPIREMIEFINKTKLPSTRLELYYGDGSYDEEDGFKLVKSFDDKIDKLLNDEDAIDSDSDSDY